MNLCFNFLFSRNNSANLDFIFFFSRFNSKYVNLQIIKADGMETHTRIIQLQKSLVRQNPTIDVKERRQILLKLRSLITENCSLIEQALFDDLHKSKEESYLTEIGIVLAEINFALKHLRKWNKKTKSFNTHKSVSFQSIHSSASLWGCFNHSTMELSFSTDALSFDRSNRSRQQSFVESLTTKSSHHFPATKTDKRKFF